MNNVSLAPKLSRTPRKVGMSSQWSDMKMTSKNEATNDRELSVLLHSSLYIEHSVSCYSSAHLIVTMNSIVGIVDMDGFKIQKRFLCKELGMLRVGEDEASSFFFDIGIRWRDLNKDDRKNCQFLIKNIHKLPLGVPHGTTSFPLKSLEEKVVTFYKSVRRNRESTLAYKGGDLECALLKRLGIPAVNLESFGCPKAEALFDNLVWLETCGNHTEPHAYHHCAKVEVEAFGHWLANHVYC